MTNTDRTTHSTFPRSRLSHLVLKHEADASTNSPDATLRLRVIRRGWTPLRRVAESEVTLLRGPPDALREIGVRVRQVLGLPY